MKKKKTQPVTNKAELPADKQCAAFTFDNPVPVTGAYDLLDCMECAKTDK